MEDYFYDKPKLTEIICLITTKNNDHLCALKDKLYEEHLWCDEAKIKLHLTSITDIKWCRQCIRSANVNKDKT